MLIYTITLIISLLLYHFFNISQFTILFSIIAFTGYLLFEKIDSLMIQQSIYRYQDLKREQGEIVKEVDLMDGESIEEFVEYLRGLEEESQEDGE